MKYLTLIRWWNAGEEDKETEVQLDAEEESAKENHIIAID